MADDKCADNVPAPAPQQSAGHSERIVHCVKFGRDLPGLDRIPWKGEIGKRVYENVSKDAWKMWLEHSKMVMNEYRLNPLDPNSQKIIDLAGAICTASTVTCCSLGQKFPCPFPEIVVAHLRPCVSQQTKPRRQARVHRQIVKRRQQFSPR